MSFIDDLPVPGQVRIALRSLGTDTPEALLGLMKASPEAFSNFVGKDAVEPLMESLRQLVPNETVRLLESLPTHFGLGAKLDIAPKIRDPHFDLSKRDTLFDEWKRLHDDPDQRSNPRVAELEAEISTLLKH